MKDMIRSSQNSIIKHVKSLQVKKYRDELGEFVIEGEKLIEEALAYGAELSFAVFGEEFALTEVGMRIFQQLQARKIAVYTVEEKLFGDISETQTPQGAMAIVKKPVSHLDEIMKREMLRFVLLDEVRDPGNLGTIVRTADACNLDAVLLLKGCVDIYNGKSVRSTMGSLFHIPVIQNLDTQELLKRLKDSGVATIGADPHSKGSVIDLKSMDKCAIVIGNESKGMGDGIKEQLEYRVSIPMPGKAESLNAGIAAAIMMYEICVRKREQPQSKSGAR